MKTHHMLSSEEISLITRYRSLAKREKQCIKDFAEALGRKWEGDPMQQSGIPATSSTKSNLLFSR